MKRVLLALFVFVSAASAAQIFRVDPAPVVSTAGNAPYGGNPALYAVAGATISLCTDPACSTPATTYTDGTGNVSCPSYAPITLPGTVVCTSTTGPQGQFGFWLAPGTYYYKVITPSGQTFGNYPVTANTAGVTRAVAGPGISVDNGGIGTVTVSNTGVLSFNGRTGAVVPALNDYNFNQLAGTLATPQVGVPQGNGTKVQLSTGAPVAQNIAKFDANGNTADSGLPSASQGSGEKIQRSTGTVTNGNCGQFDGSGNLIDAGAACATVPGGNELQYLRRKANAGPSAGTEFAYLPVIGASDYNFPPQECNSSNICSVIGPSGAILISATQATVTMTPCPLGTTGTDTAHTLYISGGAGTAEAVTIQGGSCTSGANSGSIVFTPANAHNGAWTIGSTSGGLQEAICALVPAGGVVTVQTAITLLANVGVCGKTSVTVSKGTGVTLDPAFTVLGLHPLASTGTETYTNAGPVTRAHNADIDIGPSSWVLPGPPNYVGHAFLSGGYSPALVNGASGATALMGGMQGAAGATGGFTNGVNGAASTASGINAVGIYSQAFAAAGATSAANVFGWNTWISNLGAPIEGVIGAEIDMAAGDTGVLGSDPPHNVVGIGLYNSTAVHPPGEFTALLVDAVQAGNPWGFGLRLRPGSTTNGIILDESATTGTSLYSQPLNFRAINSTGGIEQVGVYGTPWGTLNITRPISGPTQNIVSASGTVFLDLGHYDHFNLTLIGNVTLTVDGTHAGNTTFALSMCENGTGGYTVTPTSNIKGLMTINTTASKCNNQLFSWDGDGTTAMAMSAGVTY